MKISSAIPLAGSGNASDVAGGVLSAQQHPYVYQPLHASQIGDAASYSRCDERDFMGKATRKRYTVEFKAQVALEAIGGATKIGQLVAERYFFVESVQAISVFFQSYHSAAIMTTIRSFDFVYEFLNSSKHTRSMVDQDAGVRP